MNAQPQHVQPQQAAQQLPLNDIVLPDAISYWPPAIGWWLAAILLLAVIIGLWLGVKRYRQHWGYRKAALALLKQTWQEHQSTANISPTVDDSEQSQALIRKLMQITKRTAITAYPHTQIAGLFGTQWIEFLNQQTKTVCFPTDIALIINEQYRMPNAVNLTKAQEQTLYHACTQWIKKHHSTIIIHTAAHTNIDTKTLTTGFSTTKQKSNAQENNEQGGEH